MQKSRLGGAINLAGDSSQIAEGGEKEDVNVGNISCIQLIDVDSPVVNPRAQKDLLHTSQI